MTITRDMIRDHVLSCPQASLLSNAEVDEIVAELLYTLRREAAREARRMLRPASGMAVHHIDGNPHNNSLANLRVVPFRENRNPQERTKP